MRIRRETIETAIRLAGEWNAGGQVQKPDSSGESLRTFLGGLSHLEAIELMAMMSVGRGDPGTDNFQTLVNNIHSSHKHIVDYLTDKRYLAEYLEKGMKKLGLIG